LRAAAADEAQAEIAALRDSLARAEQGMADGFAAADALLTELTELATLRRTERRALARAERELKERNGSISASQAEVAELRDKLAAARETGKAALASLRYQAVAAAEAPRGGVVGTNAATDRLADRGAVAAVQPKGSCRYTGRSRQQRQTVAARGPPISDGS
jgi:hypothetical protein